MRGGFVDAIAGTGLWGFRRFGTKSLEAPLIAGCCGNSAELDDAIAKFALAYARQTDKDHDSLEKAQRKGIIRVAAKQVVK